MQLWPHQNSSPGLTDANLHFYDPELPFEKQKSAKAVEGSDGVWNCEVQVLCGMGRTVLGRGESQKFSSGRKIMSYALKWNYKNV